VKIGAAGDYTAQTDNEIALVFRRADESELSLGDEVDVDLPNVLASQALIRARDGRLVRIHLRENDLHDLRLPARHGGSSFPSAARLAERS